MVWCLGTAACPRAGEMAWRGLSLCGSRYQAPRRRRGSPGCSYSTATVRKGEEMLSWSNAMSSSEGSASRACHSSYPRQWECRRGTFPFSPRRKNKYPGRSFEIQKIHSWKPKITHPGSSDAVFDLLPPGEDSKVGRELHGGSSGFYQCPDDWGNLLLGLRLLAPLYLISLITI